MEERYVTFKYYLMTGFVQVTGILEGDKPKIDLIDTETFEPYNEEGYVVKGYLFRDKFISHANFFLVKNVFDMEYIDEMTYKLLTS
jgi:hypothetical protein